MERVTFTSRALGQAPDDGFTAYKPYGGNGVGRWGDYSAAVADGNGNIWMAMSTSRAARGRPGQLGHLYQRGCGRLSEGAPGERTSVRSLGRVSRRGSPC